MAASKFPFWKTVGAIVVANFIIGVAVFVFTRFVKS